MTFEYKPIGYLSTPFKEKFGVPRQSMMMSEARGVLRLKRTFRDALKHMDQFSHVWLVFPFHKNAETPWRALIDTPRVDAGEKIGVFATRSPHRPNALGLSVAKLEHIEFEGGSDIEIHLTGLDILDGTPVFDIKPYLPYADRIADANSGWISSEIERYKVEFSEECLSTIEESAKEHPRIKELILQMLELDPRPTSQRRAAPIADLATEQLRFAFRVLDLDIHWCVRAGIIQVTEIKKL